jgi:hypothetical protein
VLPAPAPDNQYLYFSHPRIISIPARRPFMEAGFQPFLPLPSKEGDYLSLSSLPLS